VSRSRLGEFELIRRLAERLGPPRPEGVIGIGDDTAGIPGPDGWTLYTCDVAVEGRHFRLECTPPADLGWKIATANVSDIAACGGTPRHALVSLGVAPHVTEEQLDGLYDGLAEAGRHYGFCVVGGNVTGAAQFFVDLFMTGHAARFVTRGGARPGHLLALSGPLGASAAGQEILATGARDDIERALVRRHLRPMARLDFAEALRDGASAAIDISDGLSSELHHLAEASRVRLDVSALRLPILGELRDYAARRDRNPLDWALHGGEDYELLFSFAPSERERFARLGATEIGEVSEGSDVYLDGKPLAARGWDHLRE
jgi:thiamine-monophosphate kinase